MDSPACCRTIARWNQARDDEALEGWSHLADEEPQNLRTLFLAARAFGEKYRFETMTSLVERIHRISPRSAATRLAIADLHFGVGLGDLARRDYREAASCTDASPEVFLAQAASLERAHRLEEARMLLRRAKDYPYALLVGARIHRREKQTAAAADLLRKLIDRAPAGSDLLAEAHGELALLHDSEGNYDAAFTAIGTAKAIHLGRCRDEQATSHHVTHRFATMVDSLTQEDLERWTSRPDCDDGQPRPALLTGFPRSGTTLLEQILDAHPEIGSSEEIDVLAREIFPAAHHGLGVDASIQQVIDQLTPSQLDEHRRFYWDTLKFLAPDGKLGPTVHVDKNPACNLLIPFYLRLFPQASLLVAIRDPRDVLLSCYLRYLPLNPVSVTFLNLSSTAHRYALDMTAWLKFSEMITNPWAEIRYEDVINDLPTEARKVCSALGLPWHDDMEVYREKLTGKSIASPTYADVVKPIYRNSIGRWENYRKYLEPYFETLEPFINAYGYK